MGTSSNLIYQKLTNKKVDEPDLFDYKKVYNSLDSNLLKSNIRLYNKENLETVSDRLLIERLKSIVVRNLAISTKLYKGAELYRARHWEFKKGEREYNFIEDPKEIWCPKPKHVKTIGRLNRVGQPLLYTALDALTPIHEIRSEQGNQFVIIKYRVKEDLEIVTVGMDALEMLLSLRNTDETKKIVEGLRAQMETEPGWTKNGRTNLGIIDQFLVKEFTKRVPKGQEYLYRSTVELLRMFDSYDNDGYIYPSIERGSGFNVALKPSAVKRGLEYIGLSYWTNNGYNGQEIKPADLLCNQRWSNTIKDNKIKYAPASRCEIIFEGLPKISNEIFNSQR